MSCVSFLFSFTIAYYIIIYTSNQKTFLLFLILICSIILIDGKFLFKFELEYFIKYRPFDNQYNTVHYSQNYDVNHRNKYSSRIFSSD